MLTKESFWKGIKDLRAVFGISPDKETLEIWFRHLAKLDDKYFLAGVSLMADNEKALYQNTNICFLIKDYARQAREKELALIEQVREPWQEERYQALCEQQIQKQIEADKMLIDRRPDLAKLLANFGKKGVRLLEYCRTVGRVAKK